MKSATILTIAVIVLVILGGILLTRDSAPKSTERQERPLTVVSSSSSGITSSGETISSNTVTSREIKIDATQFKFVPAIIRIREGERVNITVRNIDTAHGIFIPEFNARGRESVEFTATKKGNYPFYCATYCGSGHPDMQGTLIIE